MYKKYNTGGSFDTEQIMSMAGGAINNISNSKGKGSTIGSLIGTGIGAIATAATGGAAAPLIPALSGLGGSIGGGIDKRQQSHMDQYKGLQQAANQSVFAYGGNYSKAFAEVEGNEIMVTPSGKVKRYSGKSHEEGGIMVDKAGNPTDKTPVTNSPYVYSNRIMINGKPASDIVSNLSSKAKYKDSIANSTIKKIRDLSESYKQASGIEETPMQKYATKGYFDSSTNRISPTAVTKSYRNIYGDDGKLYQAGNLAHVEITGTRDGGDKAYDDGKDPIEPELDPYELARKRLYDMGYKKLDEKFTPGDKWQLGSMATVGAIDFGMSFRKPATMQDKYLPDAINKLNSQRFSNEAENERRLRNRTSYFNTIANSYRNSNVKAAAMSNLYAQDDLNTGMLSQQQQQMRNQISSSQAAGYLQANAMDKQSLQINWANLAEQNRLRRDAIGTIGNSGARYGQNYNVNRATAINMSMIGTSDFSGANWADIASGRSNNPVGYTKRFEEQTRELEAIKKELDALKAEKEANKSANKPTGQ